jgi:hypothetical protein
MGNRGVGPVRRLVLAGAVVAAALVVFPAPAAARPQPSRALYYETHTATGLLAIDRLSLVSPHQGTHTQVIVLPNVGLFGMVVTSGHIFWVTEAGPRDRGSIMEATVAGGDVHPVVTGLPAPNSIVAARGFIYWSDQRAIGRVALDGRHVQRRFLVLPQEPGGGVADGLATDGTHLFFSRCTEDAIGRAGLTGRPVIMSFIAPGAHSCPQGLAVAAGHLYWTELGSGTIGRADLEGSGANGQWLSIHSSEGPFQLAADAAHVYWTWGGVNGSPAYTGRVNANRADRVTRFLRDSIYPLALA